MRISATADNNAGPSPLVTVSGPGCSNSQSNNNTSVLAGKLRGDNARGVYTIRPYLYCSRVCNCRDGIALSHSDRCARVSFSAFQSARFPAARDSYPWTSNADRRRSIDRLRVHGVVVTHSADEKTETRVRHRGFYSAKSAEICVLIWPKEP